MRHTRIGFGGVGYPGGVSAMGEFFEGLSWRRRRRRVTLSTQREHDKTRLNESRAKRNKGSQEVLYLKCLLMKPTNQRCEVLSNFLAKPGRFQRKIVAMTLDDLL